MNTNWNINAYKKNIVAVVPALTFSHKSQYITAFDAIVEGYCFRGLIFRVLHATSCSRQRFIMLE